MLKEKLFSENKDLRVSVGGVYRDGKNNLIYITKKFAKEGIDVYSDGTTTGRYTSDGWWAQGRWGHSSSDDLVAQVLDAEEIELMTGRDLNSSGSTIVRAFLLARKAEHHPLPPVHLIRSAHHHWLKENRQLTGSADQGSWMVAQWSPSNLCWYHSNEVATPAKPLYGTGLMKHWEWQAVVEMPDL